MLLAIFLCAQGCSRSNDIANYVLECEKYFHNEFGLDIDNSDDTYIIVPLQGCMTCTHDCLNYIKSLKANRSPHVVVFIGRVSVFDTEMEKDVQWIKSHLRCLDDTYQHIYKYRTGFSHPMKIKLGNKGKTYKEMVYSRNIPKWRRVL